MGVPKHKFESTAHQVSIKGMLRFELKSLYGRWFYRNRAPILDYLHIGCGPNIFTGFTNLDFYRAREARRVGGDKIFRHDLRYPLPFADDTFRGAFSEHCLEHFYPAQALAILRETCRVLKPGGIFRCAVPDLATYVRFYNGEPVKGLEIYESGCEAMWSLTQNWGHLSLWDAPTLTGKLLLAGFQSAEVRAFGQGENPDLLMDTPNHQWDTIYVEARK